MAKDSVYNKFLNGTEDDRHLLPVTERIDDTTFIMSWYYLKPGVGGHSYFSIYKADYTPVCSPRKAIDGGNKPSIAIYKGVPYIVKNLNLLNILI